METVIYMLSVQSGKSGRNPMYKKALLIYNANAGQTEIGNILKRIIPILSNKITHIMLSKTEKEGDAEEIAKHSGEDYDIVISLGGDGTLHEVINGIAELEHPPIIGILPTGTCNDFARSLNIPLNVNEAAETIVKGETKSVNIGTVNNRYFTNFIGVGLISEISQNINPTTKRFMGKLGYYTAAIKSLGNEDDFEFTLETENEKFTDQARIILVLNGNYVGSTFVPVDRIDVEDDLLDIIIVYESGISLLMKYLTQKDNFEQTITEQEMKHIQAKDIRIQTKHEMILDTDGEIYLQTPIKIGVLHQKIKFIIG